MRPVPTPPGAHEAELRRAVADVRDAEVLADMARGWRTAITNLDEADRRLRRAIRRLRDDDQLGSRTRDAALTSFRGMRGYIDEQRTVFKATARALDNAGEAMARAVEIVERWDRQGPFHEPGPAPQPDPAAAADGDQSVYVKALSEHSGRVAAHSSSTAEREEEAAREMSRLSERFQRSEDKLREAHGFPPRVVPHQPGCTCSECHLPGCGCPSCQSFPACPRCFAAPCACPRRRVDTCPRCFSSPCRCAPDREVERPDEVDPPRTHPPVTSVAGDPQSPSYPGPGPSAPGLPGSGVGSGPTASPGAHLPVGAPPMAIGGAGGAASALSARGAAPIGGGPGGWGSGAAGVRPGGAGARAAGGTGALGGAGRGWGAAAAGGRGGRGGRGDEREDERPSELLAEDGDWLDGEETAPGVLG